MGMVMRIAIPTEDPGGLEAIVSPNFARAPFMTVVDIDESISASAQPNPYAQGGGGVGPMVAQWVTSLGVQAVITPSIGPNALGTLTSAGISVYTCPPGIRVREAAEMFKSGQLPPASAAQPPAMGFGPGAGMGPGMGRGRGGGWGRRRRRGGGGVWSL